MPTGTLPWFVWFVGPYFVVRCSVSFLVLQSSYWRSESWLHARIQEVLSEGSNFDNVFVYVDEGRDDKGVIINGVLLAGRWWPKIEYWLGKFVIFQAIQTSIAKQVSIFVIFQGGPDSLSPASYGSAHGLLYITCLPDVLWLLVFCWLSSRCRMKVCSVWCISWAYSLTFQLNNRQQGSSVVECLTRDRGFAGFSLTIGTALYPGARLINPCLIPVLVRLRKTRPDITEILLAGK